MEKSTMSEKEFEVIRCIGENNHFNQRLIAQQAGISLGLTNLLIKQLVKKGYLKLRQLTSKKIQYILTPKGMTEKLKKSYYFTLRAMNTLRGMKQRIQELLMREYAKGTRNFVIYGKGELATLVEIALRDLSLEDISFCLLANLNDTQNNLPQTSIIIIAEESSNTLNPAQRIRNGLQQNQQIINIMEVLSKEMNPLK